MISQCLIFIPCCSIPHWLRVIFKFKIYRTYFTLVPIQYFHRMYSSASIQMVNIFIALNKHYLMKLRFNWFFFSFLFPFQILNQNCITLIIIWKLKMFKLLITLYIYNTCAGQPSPLYYIHIFLFPLILFSIHFPPQVK